MEEITLNEIANILCVCSRNKNKSLPAIFGINNKEVYITQWITFFLDPYLNNGWYGMLNALLTFYHREVLNDKSFNDTIDGNVTVHPEYIFNDGRRIDILVSTKKYLIAIENKLWSEEQIDQTKDYSKSLEQLLNEENYKGKNLVCLYLKPKYNKSNAEEKYFKNITYGQLYGELEKSEQPYDERTKWLFEEFKTYIGEELMETYPVCSDRVNEYKNYYRIIDPIKMEFDNYLNRIDNWLKDNDELKEHGFDPSGLPNKKDYWQIVKKDKKWRTIDFHVEVIPQKESKYVERFGLADSLIIVIHLEPKSNREEIVERFMREIGSIIEGPNNTYELINIKGIVCNLSNKTEAQKTIQRMLDVIESKEFQAFYEIADEIIKGQSPNS